MSDARGPSEHCGLCLSCGAPFIARMDGTVAVGLDRAYLSILYLNSKARTSQTMQNLFRNARLVSEVHRAHIFHESHHGVALDYMMRHRTRDLDIIEPGAGSHLPADNPPIPFYQEPKGQRQRALIAFWDRPPEAKRIRYSRLRDFLVDRARRHALGSRIGTAFPVDELTTTYDTCEDCNTVMTQKKRFMDLLVRGSTALVGEPDEIHVREANTNRQAKQEEGYRHWTQANASEQDSKSLTPLVTYYLNLCLPFPDAGGSGDYFEDQFAGAPALCATVRSLYLQQSWLILEIACLCGTITRSRNEDGGLSCGYKIYLGSLDLYVSYFCWRLFQFEHLEEFDPALNFAQWHQKYFTCAGQCRQITLPRKKTVGEWVDPGDVQPRELVKLLERRLMNLYQVRLKEMVRLLCGRRVERPVSRFFLPPACLVELVDRSRECGPAEFDKALARFGIRAMTYRMRELCRSYPDDIRNLLGDFVTAWEGVEKRLIQKAHPELNPRAAGIWYDLARLVVRPTSMPATREELLRFTRGPRCSPWASVLSLANMGALSRRRRPDE